MDIDNEAIKELVRVSPAALEELKDDANAVSPVLRRQAVLLSQELVEQSGNMTIQQRMSLMESLAKLGGLGSKQVDMSQLGAGFSINIVLPGHQKTVAIASQEKVVEDVTEVDTKDLDKMLIENE